MSYPFDISLNNRYPQAIAFLRELVEINSHSDNAVGVNQNADRIIEQFTPFGFSPHRFPASSPERGQHLFLDSAGPGPAIALIAHLDTVFPRDEEIRNDFRWREEDDGRIFGPGTLDIKGGTAMIWLMLAALRDSDPDFFRSVRWILAWNAEEEAGQCVPFGRRCHSFFPPDLLAALVFEGDNAVTEGISLLNYRKGLAVFTITVEGRGAHAGARHQDGANAVWELARIVDELQSLTDYEASLTVNVGHIQGGIAHNRVPNQAEASLELRAYDPSSFEKGCAKVLALQGEGKVRAHSDAFPCRVTVSPGTQVPPWPENRGTDHLLSIWKAAGEEIGQPVEWKPRGGVSDGNWLSAHYPTLDALGPAGANTHASERSPDRRKEQEFVYAPSFIPKAKLNLTAIRHLVESRFDGARAL